MENKDSDNNINKEEAVRKQKEKIQEELYQMVMRQTNYTYEETKIKLEKFNNNYVEVIKEYLGNQRKKEEPKTVNQKIYKEIRNFMDYGSEKYERQKKHQERIAYYREKLIEEAKKRGLDKPNGEKEN